MPTQKQNYLFFVRQFWKLPPPIHTFRYTSKACQHTFRSTPKTPTPTPLSLLEIVFITTHVVNKMAGMALLVLTKYICHRLLHIGCPRNITEPVDIILQ